MNKNLSSNHFSVLGNANDNREFVEIKSRPKKNNNQNQNRNNNQNQNQNQRNKYQNQNQNQNNMIMSIKEKMNSNDTILKEKNNILDKNMIDCFDSLEGFLVTSDAYLFSGQEYQEKLEAEYPATLQLVCLKYHSIKYPCDENNWWASTEAENIIKDRIRINHGLKPIYSTTLRDPVIVNLPKPTSNPIIKEENFELPLELPPFLKPIALVREWQNEPNVWESEIVAIMKNPDDFWDVIKELNGSKSGAASRFTLPLHGKDEDADDIFTKLLNSGKRGNDDTVSFEQKQQRNVGNIVNSFNNLHPTWSFIKVDNDCTRDSKITVPFIRDAKRCAINCIDINLKDTKANTLLKIRPMDNEFESSYIARLILEFIGGILPDDISAIVFSKTIAINNNIYFKGYRLRILTSTADKQSLNESKSYIEHTFVKNHKQDTRDFSKCVVRISLPK